MGETMKGKNTSRNLEEGIIGLFVKNIWVQFVIVLVYFFFFFFGWRTGV